MAQRVRFRFAVIDLELSKADFILNAGQLIAAIKTSLRDNWGEYGLYVAAPFLRLVSLEKLSSRRFLGVIRYPRDFQTQILSTCALIWTIAEIPAAVRLRQIVGNLGNASEAVKLLKQSMALR
jgi:RNase P/RNase MRP subunit POP5